MGFGVDAIFVVRILTAGVVISALSATIFPSESWNLNMLSISSGPTPVDKTSTSSMVGERISW
jgi:hypothetical protein